MNSKPDLTQTKLNEIYERIGSLDSIYEIIGKNNFTETMLEEIDGPFLIRVDEQYETSNPKIVFVGQENNGWIGPCKSFFDKHDMQYILKHYEDFDFEITYPCNFFWCLKNIREAIFGKDEETQRRRTIVWSNFFKFNQWNQPQMNWSDYKDEVLKLQGDIFQKETDILQPDAVIFATGPYYDEIVQKFYPDVRFLEVENYSVRAISQLSSKNLPSLSFRTYHPEYAMGKGKKRVATNFYELIINFIKTNY